MLFSLWDPIIDASHADEAFKVRAYVVTPLVWLCAGALFVPKAERLYEPIATLGAIAGGVGMSVICGILDRGIDYGAAGILLVLLFVFTLLPVRLVYFLIFCAAIGGSFWIVQSVSKNYSNGMPLVNFMLIGTAVFLGIVSAIWRERQARQQFRTLKALNQSHARVEELLHSMLPRQIVRRIQGGETMIADEYGDVSIVFSDLVGFTSLSRRIGASELIALLNRLFSDFDVAAERHGMHKIKTIGDAYMAVGNLIEEHRCDHYAINAAEFAFEMQRAVAALGEGLGYPLHIRVGLHIGPVVAGVIGSSRPAFDCWGEAVNLASRLESSAAPGAVMISEAASERLRHIYRIEVLEEVDLKGIGSTRVYLLMPDRVDGADVPAERAGA